MDRLERWTERVSESCDVVLRCFDRFVHVLGPLLVASAVLLVGGCVYLYYQLLLPYHFPTTREVVGEESEQQLPPATISTAVATMVYALHYLLSVWLTVLVAFHYAMAIVTKPGAPPLTATVAPLTTTQPRTTGTMLTTATTTTTTTTMRRADHAAINMDTDTDMDIGMDMEMEPMPLLPLLLEDPAAHGSVLAGYPNATSTDATTDATNAATTAPTSTTTSTHTTTTTTPKQMMWCRKCQRSKPPRTHHCSVCESCVLKFDHHCPYVGVEGVVVVVVHTYSSFCHHHHHHYHHRHHHITIVHLLSGGF